MKTSFFNFAMAVLFSVICFPALAQDSSDTLRQYADGQNLYKIMEVSASADQDKITSQYGLLFGKYHPLYSKTGGDIKKLRNLIEAYKILSDSQKRDIYDQNGIEGLSFLKMIPPEDTLLVGPRYGDISLWSKFAKGIIQRHSSIMHNYFEEMKSDLVVRFTVTADRRIDNVEVLNESGSERYDKAILKGLKIMASRTKKIVPALDYSGNPVDSEVTVRFTKPIYQRIDSRRIIVIQR